MALIDLRQICREYQLEGITVKAVCDISLTINKGEFVAIMGPSGSGKSTLMHIIGCLDKPNSGSYYFANKKVSKLDETQLAHVRSKKIGFVFQSYNLIPRVTTLNNVLRPLIYSNTKKESRHNLALKALKKVGLEKRADHSPNQLSGGEQQRVAIARALINSPDLILADEPTGNLDTKTGDEIMKIFEGLHQKGHTVVVVTHEEEIAQKTKRIIRVRDGKLVSDKKRK
ncbi:ABC transporter ATP-binding protein [Patescibacteria group bacterium]|nr:ABC transporter ATP-binding protein [Patescibacteria group bacterium]